MAISLNQHRASITASIIAFFEDDATPLEGLSLFFPIVTSPDKELKIEVMRKRQLVAVDVSRYDRKRNTFSKSTEKVFEPPYYNEYFDFTSTDRYDVTFATIQGGGSPNVYDLRKLISSGAKYALELKNKIARAKEIQRSQVLQTGIVTLVNGDVIDYKRKAESLVQLAGAATWDNPATAKPLTDLNSIAMFIRKEGLSKGNKYRAIFGADAWANFKSNTSVTEGAKFFNQIDRTMIGMPELDEVTGMTFQGRIGSDDFIFDLFTYSDFYEDDNGNKVDYLDADTVIVLPNDFKGVTAHAGVPSIQKGPDGGQIIAPMEGEYYVRDVVDQVLLTWDFYVSSSPLAIPISVDRIGTIKTK